MEWVTEPILLTRHRQPGPAEQTRNHLPNYFQVTGAIRAFSNVRLHPGVFRIRHDSIHISNEHVISRMGIDQVRQHFGSEPGIHNVLRRGRDRAAGEYVVLRV